MFEGPEIPTDREILREIYRRYYGIFAKKKKERVTPIYVPIDIKPIAEAFGVDGDIVFGRLYYHLEQVYGYTRTGDDGKTSLVHLFTLGVEKDGKSDRHCVNFPYLVSVLADLERKHREYVIPLVISIFSLFVAIAAFLTAFYKE